MDIRRMIVGLVCWLGLIAAAGLPAAAVDKMPITVSILPQAWFVERIGGDLVEVTVLVGPGHSPATYEPTPKQMTSLQRSVLFFSAGVPFERALLPRVTALHPGPRVVGPLPDGMPEVHYTDPHAHGDLDPHTWLDPRQAVEMTDLVAATLMELRPDVAEVFGERASVLKTELYALGKKIGQQLAPARGRAFFVFHPAFGHFAAAYGLQQIALEAEGKEPGARQMTRFIEQAQQAGAKAIVVQPQFSMRSAEAVARDVGAELVTLDPLSRDYDTNLLHIAEVLGRIAIIPVETKP